MTSQTSASLPSSSGGWLRFCVLAYCVWQAADLLVAWRSNSPEAGVWLAFGLWLLPALPLWLFRHGVGRPQPGLLAVAVVLSFLGQLTWLNCVRHAGLACALAGWKRPLRGQAAWLLASLLWMPACGWLCSGLLAGGETGLRILGTALVVSWVAWRNRSAKPTAWASGRPAPRLAPSRLSGALAAFLLAVSGVASGPGLRAETLTYSPVQATARPAGLGIVDRVQLAGSDTAAAKFMTDTLPSMKHLIDTNLRETAAITNRAATGGLIALKPEALTLTMATDVRAYFVGEGAGYHNSLGFNSLGFNAAGGGVQSGNPMLIFPDASSPNSYLSSGGTKRTASEPLMPGDFVNLGTFGKGTHLDFFLIANGANGGNTVFSTDSKLNPDKINHVVTFAQVESPYVLVSFEDLSGGGDRDYNDAIFAVYIGERNVQTLLSTAALHGMPAPEPGFLGLLVAACGGALLYVRRRSKRLPQLAFAAQ